jgi:hypothetical protein
VDFEAHFTDHEGVAGDGFQGGGSTRIRVLGSGLVCWGLALDDRSTRRRSGWGTGVDSGIKGPWIAMHVVEGLG